MCEWQISNICGLRLGWNTPRRTKRPSVGFYYKNTQLVIQYLWVKLYTEYIFQAFVAQHGRDGRPSSCHPPMCPFCIQLEPRDTPQNVNKPCNNMLLTSHTMSHSDQLHTSIINPSWLEPSLDIKRNITVRHGRKAISVLWPLSTLKTYDTPLLSRSDFTRDRVLLPIPIFH